MNRAGHDIGADLLARAARLRVAVDTGGVTVSSPCHLVTVTMAPGNAVTSLEFAQRATRAHDGTTLGSLTVETIREARRLLAARVSAELSELGVGAPALSGALSALSGDLPAPEELEDAAADLSDDIPEVEVPAAWAGRPGIADVTASLEALEELRAEARNRIASYAGFAEQLAALTATASSADGAVEVVLRPGGDVVEVRLDDDELRHGARPVAARVLAVLHQAYAVLATRLAEGAQDVAGRGLDVGDLVRAHLPDGVEESQR